MILNDYTAYNEYVSINLWHSSRRNGCVFNPSKYTKTDKWTLIDIDVFEALNLIDDVIFSQLHDYVHISYKTSQGRQYRTAHRVALGIIERNKNHEVDHISRDTLDNRRSNLRDVINLKNCRNSCARSNSETGIRGICPDKNKPGKFIMVCYSKELEQLTGESRVIRRDNMLFEDAVELRKWIENKLDPRPDNEGAHPNEKILRNFLNYASGRRLMKFIAIRDNLENFVNPSDLF